MTTRKYMKKFGRGDGDCLRACVATIFGKEIEDVEDFSYGERGDTEWFVRLDNWCVKNGLPRPFFIVNVWDEEAECVCTGSMPELCIVLGTVKRSDELHCTIWAQTCAFSLSMVHDPFPGGDGLETIESMIVFLAPLSGISS